MSFLGNVPIKLVDTRVNGGIMYSFLHSNNANKLGDNDNTQQRNDSVTNRLNMEFYEEDTLQIQNMNFTLISTLRATGATTSMSSEIFNENISVTTEKLKDFRFSNDFGNVSLAISKVISF